MLEVGTRNASSGSEAQPGRFSGPARLRFGSTGQECYGLRETSTLPFGPLGRKVQDRCRATKKHSQQYLDLICFGMASGTGETPALSTDVPCAISRERKETSAGFILERTRAALESSERPPRHGALTCWASAGGPPRLMLLRRDSAEASREDWKTGSVGKRSALHWFLLPLKMGHPLVFPKGQLCSQP